MKLTCKEEKDLWTSLARHLGLIEKLEQWLKPCWLGSSSLEEQRGHISEEPPMHQLVGSRLKENELDNEKRKEVKQNEKKAEKAKLLESGASSSQTPRARTTWLGSDKSWKGALAWLSSDLSRAAWFN